MAVSSGLEASVKRYPLQELLELRRRDEESAATAWAAARRRVDLAEAEAGRMASRAAEVRARLQRAEQAADSATPAPRMTGAELAGRAHYLTRLRDAATRAAADRDAFRVGALATARAEERRAAEAFAGKRGAREASELHEAQFRAEERRSEERREEEARDDAAGAARHARLHRP